MLCVLFFCALCEKKNIGDLSWGVLSLTELTELTELFCARFDPTERLRHTDITEASPPAPLRMERGVVCEVTPTGLLMVGDGLLSLRRTYRGNLGNHSPLHSERGWG